KTLLGILEKKSKSPTKIVSLQCWRCHQLCSDRIPGTRFPKADDLFVKGYSLYKAKVFNEWERWNFVEIFLGYVFFLSFIYNATDSNMRRYMKTEVDIRDELLATNGTVRTNHRIRSIHNQLIDLENNILL